MVTEGLEHAPKPGEIFAGKYRVERVLGVGGMGYVIAATHLQLHERVAIKMLLPALAVDPNTVERFLREGRAAVKIQSEHCVRVQDVGELPDRTPYMVMEYLDGQDLADVLRERGRLEPHVAVDYVLEACEAIAEAHRMKIVHRDLKPANLFLQRLGNGGELVKVLDFGISKIGGQPEGSMSMTRTSAMMGSPLYMSPEQLKSAKNVDERADQWALGVILYELISGQVPFNAETLAELGALVLSGETPWLADLAPGAPPDLCGVVATCLRRKPSERFTNLADFAVAAAPFGSPRAQKSADVIVRTLGMPSMRAQRVSLSNVAAQGPVSLPNMGVAGNAPVPSASPSSPRAMTFAEPSAQKPEPTRPAPTHSRWPLAIVPLALLVFAGVGFAGVLRWRAHRAIDVALATPPPVLEAPNASSASALPAPSSGAVVAALSSAPTGIPVASASRLLSMSDALPGARKPPPRTTAPVTSLAAKIPSGTPASSSTLKQDAPAQKAAPNPDHATSSKD